MKEENKFNAKYEFLNLYVKNNKELDDDLIWNLLNEFFEFLPRKTRQCQTRIKNFEMIKEELLNSFNRLVLKIAKCPFIEIKIDNKQDLDEKLINLELKNQDIYIVVGKILAESLQLQEKTKKLQELENTVEKG